MYVWGVTRDGRVRYIGRDQFWLTLRTFCSWRKINASDFGYTFLGLFKTHVVVSEQLRIGEILYYLILQYIGVVLIFWCKEEVTAIGQMLVIIIIIIVAGCFLTFCASLSVNVE